MILVLIIYSLCIRLIFKSSVISLTDNRTLRTRTPRAMIWDMQVDVACSYVHGARFHCITAWSVSLPRRVREDLSVAVTGCSASLTLRAALMFYRNYPKWAASPKYLLQAVLRLKTCLNLFNSFFYVTVGLLVFINSSPSDFLTRYS